MFTNWRYISVGIFCLSGLLGKKAFWNVIYWLKKSKTFIPGWDRFSAPFCGRLVFWRRAQKIKIVVKNKHIISVLIFSSITGHGQSWACRSGESGPHMNTAAIFGSLLSNWPSSLYFLIPEGVWVEEQRLLHAAVYTVTHSYRTELALI